MYRVCDLLDLSQFEPTVAPSGEFKMVRKSSTAHESLIHRRNAAATALAAPDQRAEADLAAHFREYARERPEMVALWCLGVGFLMVWTLKP
jgi:ferric-dicitrate binding protein FerR (iron transport regulator)